MSNISSEKFFNNQFQCLNYACHCDKDIENVTPGAAAPKTTLKLYSDLLKPLNYSYVPIDGLDLTGKNGGVIEHNILGKLLSLNKDNIDAHIKFIEEYGFLFPVSNDKYESVDANALIAVINHIKATVRLTSAIAGKINYKDILISTAYLLYSAPVTISLSTGSYTTCVHPFTEYLNGYNYFPDLTRNREIFSTGKLSVPDTMIESGNYLDSEFISSIASGSDNTLLGSRDPMFKHLFAMYTNLKTEDEQLRRIIDFFYHYQTEVGIFKNVEYGRISFYNHSQRENFTDAMKIALVEIAKAVISEEINHNIEGIHLKFNSKTLTPVWQVNTLLQALYFSIFYMKPGVEIYKECENPNCKRQAFFLTNATKTNKRYCCEQCRRAAATQRCRLNKKRREQEKK